MENIKSNKLISVPSKLPMVTSNRLSSFFVQVDFSLKSRDFLECQIMDSCCSVMALIDL